jgi:FHS family L-fucose permease-like MFS transporter
MLVETANWGAYFLMALPAAVLMRRMGYKAGMLAGLFTAVLGCFLFIPAAKAALFPLLLTALFITASGMVFLETAANPYISVLGRQDRAAFRLNLAQSFNGLAALVAGLWLSKMIIKKETPEQVLALFPKDEGVAKLVTESATLPESQRVDFLLKQLHEIAPAAHKQYLLDQAAMVITPYVCIGVFLLLIAILFVFVKLPEIKEEAPASDAKSFSIFHHPLLLFGVIAQFCYVGVQCGIDANFINYTKEVTGLSQYDATTYLGLILGCFFLGRVSGTVIMSRVSPALVLLVFCIGTMGLMAAAALIGTDPHAGKHVVSVPGWLGLGDELVFTTHAAPYLFMGMKFLMSIMFPTIFSLSLRGLGSYTKIGSSFLVMSIVGGALIPLIMGKVADTTHSYKDTLWPLVVFMLPVLYFAIRARRDESAS